MWERILEALRTKGNVPNTFTRYIGKQLKSAREEAGLSQNELAKKIYRRRPSISDMENGKMMPDFGTVVLLAMAVKKPILYFIHSNYLRGPDLEPELSDLEHEILIHFRRLGLDKQKIAVKQVKALSE